MKNIRTCIACRAKQDKYELHRIVAEDKQPVLDVKQTVNSRGIYICKKLECIDKLLKAKDMTKVIKIDVKMDSLKELLKNLGE